MAFLNVTYISVPGATATAVTGIDAAGDIVGTFSANGVDHGFIDRGGVFTIVDAPGLPGAAATGAVVAGVSTSGVLFGTFATGGGDPTGAGNHGFTDNAGVFTTIDVPGQLEIHLAGVDPAGDVVGTENPSGQGAAFDGFVDKAGAFSIVNIAGGNDTQLLGVNDAGVAFGTGLNGGVLVTDTTGVVSALSVPGAETTPLV